MLKSIDSRIYEAVHPNELMSLIIYKYVGLNNGKHKLIVKVLCARG